MRTKNILILALVFIMLCFSVSAGTITSSLGTYETETYKQGTVNIPVTVVTNNITGSVEVTLIPKAGISCDTCTYTPSFTGGTNEQKIVTFTLTGTIAGTYNPPFMSITASSGSTQASPISSGNQVVVIERPTWVKTLATSKSSMNIGDEATLTLTIKPSGGNFEDVLIDLVLPSGMTLTAGTASKNAGTISGESSYQWKVKATTAGTKAISAKISASNPQESASLNTETVSITIASDETDTTDDSPKAGGSSGGGAGGASTPKILSKDFGNITGSHFMEIDDKKISFTKVDFTVSGLVIDAKLTAENWINTENISIDSEEVYSFVELKGEEIEQQFDYGSVNFKITNVWLDENINQNLTLALKRFDGSNWVDEEVESLRSDENFTYYKAKISGLGVFAIGTLKKTLELNAALEEMNDTTLTDMTTNAIKDIEAVEPEEIVNIAKNNILFTGFLGIVIIIGIISSVFAIKSRKHEVVSKDSEAKLDSHTSLKNFVHKQRNAGKSEDEIVSHLKEAGWRDEHIAKALKKED